MKTYDQMLDFVIGQSNNGNLRYVEWVACVVIAEAYNTSPETVMNHINQEKERQKIQRRALNKAKNQASNEQRRLANLARKQNEQPS